MEELTIRSSTSVSLSESLMSRYSTPSAPASELGHLALSGSSSGSSGKRMAPTTRSMSRRQTLASLAGPSRTTPNASRAPQARSGAPGRQPSQQPEQEEDDDDESESEDEDENEDESDDDEAGNGGGNGGGAEDAARRLWARIFDIYALSEPNGLTGAELITANGNSEGNTRIHKELATLAARQASANPAFCNALLQTVEIPGPRWSQVMCANLTKRLRTIFENFERGMMRGPTHGPDVISTAEALRDLVTAIDRITTNGYWAGLSPESRRRFVSLLLTVIEQVVAADRDLYENTTVARPLYAGQTAEHTNLYRRLIGNTAVGSFGVTSLHRLDVDGRLLASSFGRIDAIYAAVMTKYYDDDGPRRGSSPPPFAFIQVLRQLRNNASRQVGQ